MAVTIYMGWFFLERLSPTPRLQTCDRSNLLPIFSRHGAETMGSWWGVGEGKLPVHWEESILAVEGNEQWDSEEESNDGHERFRENNVDSTVHEPELENNADVVNLRVLVMRQGTDLAWEVDSDTERESRSIDLSFRVSHENSIINAITAEAGELRVSQEGCEAVKIRRCR